MSCGEIVIFERVDCVNGGARVGSMLLSSNKLWLQKNEFSRSTLSSPHVASFPLLTYVGMLLVWVWFVCCFDSLNHCLEEIILLMIDCLCVRFVLRIRVAVLFVIFLKSARAWPVLRRFAFLVLSILLLD